MKKRVSFCECALKTLCILTLFVTFNTITDVSTNADAFFPFYQLTATLNPATQLLVCMCCRSCSNQCLWFTAVRSCNLNLNLHDRMRLFLPTDAIVQWQIIVLRRRKFGKIRKHSQQIRYLFEHLFIIHIEIWRVYVWIERIDWYRFRTYGHTKCIELKARLCTALHW